MKQEIDQILENNKIDKIKFYQYTTPLTNNIFTACLFLNTEKKQIVARGVSICSLRDSFIKKKGKHKAFGRAVEATVHKTNSYKIKSEGREEEFVTRVMKIKTVDKEKEFKATIIPELLKINPKMPISISKANNRTLYSFKLPVSYPMIEAHKFFKYKSSYLPNVANGEENKFFTDEKESMKEK